MFNNLSPEYLSSLIPPTVNTISQCNLRNAQNIETVNSRTTQYYNSFLPSSIREWKYLPLGVRNIDPVIILTMISFKKRITDSPLCLCGNVENTDHYFMRCTLYRKQRAELNHKISKHPSVTLQILLFGNPLLSFPTNTLIFEAVHKYVLLSLIRSASNIDP